MANIKSRGLEKSFTKKGSGRRHTYGPGKSTTNKRRGRDGTLRSGG